MPRKVCKWTEIEPDSRIYNTCQEGEEFHLDQGMELYPFCMWCGGKIVPDVELPDQVAEKQ